MVITVYGLPRLNIQTPVSPTMALRVHPTGVNNKEVLFPLLARI